MLYTHSNIHMLQTDDKNHKSETNKIIETCNMKLEKFVTMVFDL